MLNGLASNLATIILSFTGLYPIRASLARLFNRKPTPASCRCSFPDHIILLPLISPACVQRISEIPRMSHLYLCISSWSSCSLPAAHSVRTFHVPIDNTSIVGLILLSVADFSIQPRLLSWSRGPCLIGRHPSWHACGIVLCGIISCVCSLLSAHQHSSDRPSSLTGLGIGTRGCWVAAPQGGVLNPQIILYIYIIRWSKPTLEKTDVARF